MIIKKLGVGFFFSLWLFHLPAYAGLSSTKNTNDLNDQTNWTGIYLGVQGGHAKSKLNWTFPFDQYFTIPDGNKAFHTEPSGSTAGGQLGFNYQMKHVVIGVEGALNATSFEQLLLGPVEPLFPLDKYTTSINKFSSVVGRLGFAYKNWLPYVRGGFAQAKIKINATSGSPGAGVIGQVALKSQGSTIGAGLEYQIIPLAIVGIEYNYMKFPGKTYSTATTGPVEEPFFIRSSGVKLHVISARISVKIDELMRIMKRANGG